MKVDSNRIRHCRNELQRGRDRPIKHPVTDVRFRSATESGSTPRVYEPTEVSLRCDASRCEIPLVEYQFTLLQSNSLNDHEFYLLVVFGNASKPFAPMTLNPPSSLLRVNPS